MVMRTNTIFFHQCLPVTVFEVVIGVAVPLAIQIKWWDNFYVCKHLKDKILFQKLKLGKTKFRHEYLSKEKLMTCNNLLFFLKCWFHFIVALNYITFSSSFKVKLTIPWDSIVGKKHPKMNFLLLSSTFKNLGPDCSSQFSIAVVPLAYNPPWCFSYT